MFRPVKILALGFRNIPEQQIWNVLQKEKAYQPDLIVLPEAWLGDEYPKEKCETVLNSAAEIARDLHSYLVCPLYHLTGKDACRNSAFLLDRQGRLINTFDKIFPYWKEFREFPPCEPGRDITVLDADFGRIGFAVCFDVNFPALWHGMEQAGAELVLWPSDYSAGRALQAHAITCHYYIASATRYPDSIVYDISGDEISYAANEGIVIHKTVLDLDRCIFHENFNLEKCERLLAKYPDIIIEKKYPREQWFILSSSSGNTSVKKAAAEFGMEELRAYLNRSGKEINPRWHPVNS